MASAPSGAASSTFAALRTVASTELTGPMMAAAAERQLLQLSKRGGVVNIVRDVFELLVHRIWREMTHPERVRHERLPNLPFGCFTCHQPLPPHLASLEGKSK